MLDTASRFGAVVDRDTGEQVREFNPPEFVLSALAEVDALTAKAGALRDALAGARPDALAGAKPDAG